MLTAAVAFAGGVGIAGFGSERAERAAEMTSYSSKQGKSNVPELFTIPQDQMSHVQVVTILPTTMVRKLRLTGAVAYNAFATTHARDTYYRCSTRGTPVIAPQF